MTDRGRRPWRWGFAGAILLLAACGGGDDDAAATPEAAEPTTTTIGTGDGTFEVRQLTFVDPSRPTGDVAGRTLPTDVYVPGGDGPFPLILHAHGMDGSAAKFSELLGGWAEAGYVVVAPDFPRTNDGAAPELRSLSDYANQPADLRFVLDEVLALAEPGGSLEGLIAEEHLGVSGMSLGGATAYGMLFHDCCRDDRVDAAVLMSAPELPFEGGEFDHSGELPVLVFAGTGDLAVPYEVQQAAIARLPGPTWSVTLLDGLHAPPFEDAPSPHDDLVAATTAEFWAMTLRDDPAAADRLVSAASVTGLSRIDPAATG